MFTQTPPLVIAILGGVAVLLVNSVLSALDSQPSSVSTKKTSHSIILSTNIINRLIYAANMKEWENNKVYNIFIENGTI